MRIVVTVGMGQWPFDRLLRGVIPLCAEHEVFAQTGTSTLAMPCETEAFIGFDALMQRLEAADLIITHGGNTVRIAQRLGKLPIATAREERFGEMANDHQIPYIRHEEALGRVVAAWDPGEISRLIAAREGGWTLDHPVPEPRAAEAAARLTQIWHALGSNPFSWKREPALAFFWEELAFSSGRHLACGSHADRLARALDGKDIGFESVGECATRPGRYDSISLVSSGAPDGMAGEVRWAADHLLPDGRLMLCAKRSGVTGLIEILMSQKFEIERRDEAGDMALISVRSPGSESNSIGGPE